MADIKKRNILILQNKILHYRKPLFNSLSKYYNVTVLHSGNKSKVSTDYYNEIIVRDYRVSSLRIQPATIKLCTSKKYDIIISMMDLHWILNVLSAFIHPPEVVFIWWGAWLTGNKIADQLKVTLLNRRNASILYTDKARNEFISCGVQAQKLFVANNTFHVPFRPKMYYHQPKNKILCIGSFDPRKEHLLMIKSFISIVRDINQEIKLYIIGDGKLRPELKNFVDSNNISNRIIFTGAINDANVLRHYYRDAICSISYGQAGLSVLQSFGYGVPYITTKSAISGGEISNIIDGHNGFLCDSNRNSFQNVIKHVCNNNDMAATMGKNAYNYYTNNCTMQNMVDAFRDTINY